MTSEDIKSALKVAKRDFALDPNSNVFAVSESEKLIKGRNVKIRCITLTVPIGSKKNYKDNKDQKEIPRMINGVITDVIEEDVPSVTVNTGCLMQKRRPFSIGMQIAVWGQGPGTASIIGRVPGIGDVLFTCWHIVAHFSESETEVLKGKVVYQGLPFDPADRIGTVFAVNKPKIYQTLSTENVEPSHGDFAMILLDPSGKSPMIDGKNPPLGSSMDTLIDTIFNTPELYGYFKGSPWISFPHYHALFNNKVATIINDDQFSTLPYPTGLGVADIGDSVWKVGRTTGPTYGTVVSKNISTWVSYSVAGYAFIDGCFAITPDLNKNDKFGLPGDSGSALFDDKRYCVGSCFAGFSSTGKMFATNIQTEMINILGDELARKLMINNES
jgi:hypothetical protein